MLKSAVFACACLFLTTLAAQQQHVTWTPTVDAPVLPGSVALIRVQGKIEPGWHLYSASSATGIPTSFKIGPDALIESTRIFQPPPKKAFDANFNAESETYEDGVTFLVAANIRKEAPAGAAELTISARYQTCTSTVCV